MLKFTSIGDCVVDVYPQFNQSFLGGSAFNVCLAAQKLQVKAGLISAVGQDSWGQKYFSACSKFKINSQLLISLPTATSHVAITLNQNHSPNYSKWQLGALKLFKLTPNHQEFLATQTAAHCTAIKPLKSLLQQFSQLKLPGVFKSADFDGDTPYSFSVQDIPRYLSGLNLVSKSLSLTDFKSLTFLKNLALKSGKLILVTLGSSGSRIFTPNQTFFQPSIKTKTKDTTGAGDTYLANFLIHYLKAKNIPQAMKLATQAATEKITRLGASS